MKIISFFMFSLFLSSCQNSFINEIQDSTIEIKNPNQTKNNGL
ncbi:Uncharacterised protein [Providencia rettgeri]|nr:Uncharacterised protein [Providencia rettgeri]